ncbi:transporter substrate-binding domain-containing protein [Paraburkholderia tropica]|uniref:transporter substrate-binding domain-containing protein n=1 Tax=Paraburkholderia tropica TaxID=92647 RepID=UPI002AB6E8A0|nr:transporter substrate-binding domain-containing protein [Paraburkholderia tropica]
MKKREFLSSLPFAAAAAVPFVAAPLAAVPTPARAEVSGKSTWDRIQSTKVLRVGAAILEPWYFKDTTDSSAPGKVMIDGVAWRGICPAIAQETAKAMGVKLQMVETTWGNAVAGLQADQFDAMFMLDATPQRATSIDFVQTPMLWYPLGIIAKESISIKNWTDLNDPKYKLAVALGTNSDEYISDVARKATISRFQSFGEVFAAFQSGRTDAAVVSAIASDLARARLKTAKTIVPKPTFGIPGAIAVRKEADQRWSNFLNVVASYYYNSGKTQRFYDQFLTFRGVDPKTAVSVQRELWT